MIIAWESCGKFIDIVLRIEFERMKVPFDIISGLFLLRRDSSSSIRLRWNWYSILWVSCQCQWVNHKFQAAGEVISLPMLIVQDLHACSIDCWSPEDKLQFNYPNKTFCQFNAWINKTPTGTGTGPMQM